MVKLPSQQQPVARRLKSEKQVGKSKKLRECPKLPVRQKAIWLPKQKLAHLLAETVLTTDELRQNTKVDEYFLFVKDG
jgi:hypothetical protein